jgi:pimeloyl-ACP methyl ester carboxylesterase
MVMTNQINIFKSVDSKVQYETAYNEMLKRWPVPYREQYVPTRFGDTHVIVSGSQTAHPLVLLHSAGSGAVQWFRNIGLLSKQYYTFAIDTIGEVNKSVTTKILHTRQDFVDWIIDLFNGLKIEKANLVGNSFGGLLAFNTALYLPERVKKVVLISPAATFLQMCAFYYRVAIPYKIGYVLGSKRLIMSGFNWLWQGFPRDEEFTRYTEIGKTGGFPSNHLAPPVYNDKELRQIRNPMLLLIGDHEVIYNPRKVIERATHLVNGLKAEIIPNANHNAQVTVPDIINAKILEFLASEHSAA